MSKSTKANTRLYSRRTTRLTGPELARALGVTETKRADWARKGVVSGSGGRQTYAAADAIELGLVTAIYAAVGSRRGKGAWERLRIQLPDLSDAGQRAWAIIDVSLYRHAVACTTEEATSKAAEIPGSVHVLSLHEIAVASLRRFSEAVSSKPKPDRPPTRRRQQTPRTVNKRQAYSQSPFPDSIPE
jgi:hypothetical protein